MSNCHWRGSIGKQIQTVAETESQTFFRESLNGRSQSMFSPWTWRDSMWGWVEERLEKSKTMPEDLGPLNQLSKAHRDWNCKHRACMDLYQFLCTNIRAVALVFCGTPNRKEQVYLGLFYLLGYLSFYWNCHVQPQYEGSHLLLMYLFFWSHFSVVSWRPAPSVEKMEEWICGGMGKVRVMKGRNLWLGCVLWENLFINLIYSFTY